MSEPKLRAIGKDWTVEILEHNEMPKDSADHFTEDGKLKYLFPATSVVDIRHAAIHSGKDGKTLISINPRGSFEFGASPVQVYDKIQVGSRSDHFERGISEDEFRLFTVIDIKKIYPSTATYLVEEIL